MLSAVSVMMTASCLIVVGPATAAQRAKAPQSWTISKTPAVPAARYVLNGVSCPSSTSCEAVGDDDYGASETTTFVEQLIGSTWSVTPSPSPATGGILFAVSCVNPSACMAVGSTGTQDPLAEWWNGSNWTITPTVNFNAELQGVSCTTGTAPQSVNCVAVGYIQGSSAIQSGGILIETWNGSSWSVSVGPQNEIPGNLLSVSCPVQGQCMAVGTSSDQNLAVQLSNNSWSELDAPNASGSYINSLVSVSCPGGSSCADDWWSDYKTQANSIQRTLNWNGDSWSTGRTFVNKGAYTQLDAIGCSSITSCVVVGSKGGGPTKTLVEDWNGSGWKIERSASQTTQSYLKGVSCVSSTFCVGVGESGAFGEFEWPLIESGPA
jgi:hypothetical protein